MADDIGKRTYKMDFPDIITEKNNNRNGNSLYRKIIDKALEGCGDEKKVSILSKMQAYIEEKKESLTETRKKSGNKHPRNTLNDLNGNEWAFFTKTILRTSYPSEFSHNLRKVHYANKPPLLMKHLIEFCTRAGQIVLDPFAGVGGTLLGASLCGRKAIGIEINKKWIDTYEEVCRVEGIDKQEMIQGDCLEKMLEMKKVGKSVDAIVTDPPYSPSLKKTLCDGKYGWSSRRSNFDSFSVDEADFRNVSTFEEYYNKMEQAGQLMFDILRPKGYLMVMIRDSYQSGEYIPASFYVGERLKKAGFTLKGIKLWHQTGAPVRPYGYPYSYVPNIVHHSILILKKEKQ